jgi:hypothetical protein
MAYKPFKVDVIKVLRSAYASKDTQDKLTEFVLESEFKQLFGIRMVDRIVERTRDENVDRFGKSLGKYSKAYKKSLIFQIYGKSDAVDLTLTGAMLESLASDETGKMIIINVAEDQKGKAEGHITGKLGKFGRAKPRNFLGLPDGEVNKIFKESLIDYRSGAFSEILV